MSSKRNKKGILLPPTVGYSLKIVFKLVRANTINLTYYPRLLAITLINLINWPFRTYERFFINPSIRKSHITKDPIFIIGHWRSGTTHLHNILSQDNAMAYVTTYQSVFPDTLFNKAGRFLFEIFMKLLIPGKRKGDNVELGPSYPQEEEFTLGARTPVCYYYFWMFPRNILKYYDSFVRFKGMQSVELQYWKDDYEILIRKALKNTGGNQFLSKNPTNTGRIQVLLDQFPNAKFIHIHRNPIDVFLSTLHFYSEMLKPLQLQHIENSEIEDAVFEIYKRLMNDYFNQKDLIPAGNLIEISYDELEEHPLQIADRIYKSLNLEYSATTKQQFLQYLEGTKSYARNKHSIKKKHLQKVEKEWGFVFANCHYSIPENIQISDA